MKAAIVYRLAIGLFIASLLIFGYGFLPTQVQAQENSYSDTSQFYSQEELAQVLAPIALYPDALLSQVLMAATYPIEVIEADRWRKNNLYLQDQTLDEALVAQNWDPSVKALCHFPDLLALMSERIGETTDLGNAFLAQEAQVMDTVQSLRAAAYAQGNLASSDRQQVVVEREIIVIEPADPRIIYVPYYDPYTIYGPWWYPAYPPWYWGPPGVSLSFGIGYWPGFFFSFSFGNWSYFDWHRHYIHIDIHKRPRYVRHDRWFAKPGRWRHAPLHRRGVAYRDKSTARRYGQAPHLTHTRRELRGFPVTRQTDRYDTHTERDHQVRQRVNRQIPQRIDRPTPQRIDRQVRQRIDRPLRQPTAQTRQRLEKDRHTRERVLRHQDVDRGRSVRQQIRQDRQQRERMTREIRQQRKIHPDTRLLKSGRTRQQPVRAGSESRGRSLERPQQRQSRDSVFSRVDEGRQPRQSSARGQSSRQGRTIEGRGRGGNRDSGRMRR